MTTSGFTPGPWAYGSNGEIYRDDMAGEAIYPRIAMIDLDNTTVEQANADGRLIAAAPDLLKALKALLLEADILSGNIDGRSGADRWPGAMGKARAAIARAEGRGGLRASRAFTVDQADNRK